MGKLTLGPGDDKISICSMKFLTHERKALSTFRHQSPGKLLQQNSRDNIAIATTTSIMGLATFFSNFRLAKATNETRDTHLTAPSRVPQEKHSIPRRRGTGMFITYYSNPTSTNPRPSFNNANKDSNRHHQKPNYTATTPLQLPPPIPPELRQQILLAYLSPDRNTKTAKYGTRSTSSFGESSYIAECIPVYMLISNMHLTTYLRGWWYGRVRIWRG